MMDLLTKLTDEMKSAMRAGQKDRLGVLRMLITEVKNIDLNPAKPTAEQVVESYAKKLRKSADEFAKVNRPEEVKKIEAEILVVEEFMPKKLSREETMKLVDEFLAANS
ncbi:MAG TPA: GatB/YqeY domain-containing protein, partial [Tepidisphaeraceae bacterium]|nr:GatB/YqeY domain-containing protein [Tepidisphaeraceae bacterium]